MANESVQNSTQVRSRNRNQDRISEEEKLAMEALARDAAGDPQPRRHLSPSEMVSMLGNMQSDSDPGELRGPNRFFMNNPTSDPRLYMSPEIITEREAGPIDDEQLPPDPETRMLAQQRLIEAFRSGKMKGVQM